jgi:hypothetical protein
MFHWYQMAARCYVYLSDVSVHDFDQGDGLWKSAFVQSRWFSRGWTLQELIAPASVEFFSQEGERPGDKKSLEKEITEITEINVLALRGNPCPILALQIECHGQQSARPHEKKTMPSGNLRRLHDTHLR